MCMAYPTDSNIKICVLKVILFHFECQNVSQISLKEYFTQIWSKEGLKKDYIFFFG